MAHGTSHWGLFCKSVDFLAKRNTKEALLWSGAVLDVCREQFYAVHWKVCLLPIFNDHSSKKEA